MDLVQSLPARWIAPARLAVVVALALAGAVAIASLESGADEDRITRLRAQEEGFRTALWLYRLDHGHAPCQSGDENRAADPELFVLQLTRFTNANGRPAPTRDEEFRYGPYLDSWPAQAVTGSARLVIRRAGEASPIDAHHRGGWTYDPRGGALRPDLPEEWDADLEAP